MEGKHGGFFDEGGWGGIGLFSLPHAVLHRDSPAPYSQQKRLKIGDFGGGEGAARNLDFKGF